MALPETLTGTVERVTYHDEESGFCVVQVTTSRHAMPATVVGRLPAVNPGEILTAEGLWKFDPEHGRQFEAERIRVAAPTSASGIEKYLGSGVIRGIGPSLAKSLVGRFGVGVIDVIANAPKKLQRVKGIGKMRAAQISESWREREATRDAMVFLHGHGIGSARALRILKTYGTDTIAFVTEDPYRLAREIRGIGFQTADAIAQTLGIEKSAPMRARAGVGWVLGEATQQGHCALPNDDLLTRCEKDLGIERSIAAGALAAELAEGTLVADAIGETDVVFLKRLRDAELGVAAALRRLTAGRPPWGAIEPQRAVAWVERRLAMQLAPAQAEAVAKALTSKVLVITGGPGVGKTTIVNAILRILSGKGVEPTLCAPTGRAAKRLAETTGKPARTIHRLLEVNPATGTFTRSRYEPLETEYVIVDETSMVDIALMYALLDAIPHDAALLLVGDVDQLPSVGPGAVLADIIDSGVVPVVRLTEVFRQAAQSAIIANAHRINHGEMPDLARHEESDFFFVAADDPAAGASMVVRLVTERIPARYGLDPLRDVQVLTPMHKGELGTRNLNQLLQGAVPRRAIALTDATVTSLGYTYAHGDKVMQTENDYQKDVYNGDIGVISEIDPEEKSVTVRFEGKDVAYTNNELDELTLAYATTIHKSQGSEYPAIVIAFSTQHYAMLQRKLLYTAVTRARKLVVIVGQRRALEIAIGTSRDRKRWTKLRERLVGNGVSGSRFQVSGSDDDLSS
jgi:exodeoxyribonuclease V alpha subunit